MDTDEVVFKADIPKGKKIKTIIYFTDLDLDAIREWWSGLKCPPVQNGDMNKSETVRILVHQGLDKERSERI